MVNNSLFADRKMLYSVQELDDKRMSLLHKYKLLEGREGYYFLIAYNYFEALKFNRTTFLNTTGMLNFESRLYKKFTQREIKKTTPLKQERVPEILKSCNEHFIIALQKDFLPGWCKFMYADFMLWYNQTSYAKAKNPVLKPFDNKVIYNYLCEAFRVVKEKDMRYPSESLDCRTFEVANLLLRKIADGTLTDSNNIVGELKKGRLEVCRKINDQLLNAPYLMRQYAEFMFDFNKSGYDIINDSRLMPFSMNTILATYYLSCMRSYESLKRDRYLDRSGGISYASSFQRLIDFIKQNNLDGYGDMVQKLQFLQLKAYRSADSRFRLRKPWNDKTRFLPEDAEIFEHSFDINNFSSEEIYTTTESPVEQLFPDVVFRQILLGSIQERSPLHMKKLKYIESVDCIKDYGEKADIDNFLCQVDKSYKLGKKSVKIFLRSRNQLMNDYPTKKVLDLKGLEYLKDLKSLSLVQFESYKCPKLKPSDLPNLKSLIIADCKRLPQNLQIIPVKEFRTNVELDDGNVDWLNGHKYIEDLTLMVNKQNKVPANLHMPAVKILTLKSVSPAFKLQELLIDINKAFPNLEELYMTDIHQLHMTSKLMDLLSQSMPNIETLIFWNNDKHDICPFIRNSLECRLRSNYSRLRDDNQLTLKYPNIPPTLSFKSPPILLSSTEKNALISTMKNLKTFVIGVSKGIDYQFDHKLNKLTRLQLPYVPSEVDIYAEKCPKLKEIEYSTGPITLRK